MLNCFNVDVSCSQADEIIKLDVSGSTGSNYLSYSYETVVMARNNVDEFNVFNQNSKINYDSKIIRGIHVQGEVYSDTQFTSLGIFYVILYKTILGENNEIYSMHPVDQIGSLKDWFLYREPEIVLTYKTYKNYGYKNRQPKRSFRINISYNKPVLFRPNDVIIVEYAFLAKSILSSFLNFKVYATAEVCFDSV